MVRLALLTVPLALVLACSGVGGGEPTRDIPSVGRDVPSPDAVDAIADGAPADLAPTDTRPEEDAAEDGRTLDGVAVDDGGAPTDALATIDADAAADTEWQCRTDVDCAWLGAAAGPCRAARCELPAGTCSLIVADDGLPCDDEDACTGDGTCAEGLCLAADPRDCDDADPCTDDTCTRAAGCVHAAVADCCRSDADCDDGNVCTQDRCPGDGLFCKHRWTDGCCASDAECDDGDDCTLDTCTAEGCTSTPLCCASDAECDDGEDCTVDLCLEGTCAAVADALSPCCVPTAFATGFDSGRTEGFTFTPAVSGVGWQVVAAGGEATGPSLYYGDPTRHTYDTGSANGGTALSPPFVLPARARATLHFRMRMNTESYFEKLTVLLVTPYGSVRLLENADGLHTWQDLSAELRGAAGLPVRVAFVFSADSSIFDEGVYLDDIRVVSTCALDACETVADCVDESTCTTDTCTDGVCGFAWQVDCCVADADCNDDSPCTRDFCSGGSCVFASTGDPACCTTDDDCADDDPCTSATCVAHGCAIVRDEALCPTTIPYVQSFDDAATFGAIGWQAATATGETSPNWKLREADGQLPTRFVRFDYAPIALAYEHCLRLPTLTLRPARDVNVQLTQRFSGFVGSDADNRLSIVWSVDGGATESVLWAWHESEGDIPLSTLTRPLTVPAAATELTLALCVAGEDSFEINFWDIDDVAVTSGTAPVWTDVPEEEVAAAAEATTTVPVAARDADGDALHFALAPGAPAFARLDPSGPSSASLVLTPTAADEGVHTLGLLVDDGGPAVPAVVQVRVTLPGLVRLYDEDFATGTLAELGWTLESDAGSSANDWRLAVGEPFGSRHARYEGVPAVANFSDAIVSPPIAVGEMADVRVRFGAELLARAAAVADPPVRVALQVEVGGGLFETIWSHDERAGDLPAGQVTADATVVLAGATTTRLRFRLRGGDSSAILRFVVDDVVVEGRTNGAR